MSNLNPDQFFHGTTHEITGMVTPARVAGTRVSGHSEGDPGNMSGGDHAFAIRNDEDYAWRAALQFHNNGQRPRVYEVEPAADMRPGPWHKDHPDFARHAAANNHDPATIHQDEWGSRTGFRVKSQIDIAPGHQGTFPEVNWNQFRKQGHGGYDANHPSDDRIKWGGLGGIPDDLDVARATPRHISDAHDWRNDKAPHSELREMAGRPQKRLATLFGDSDAES